MEVKYTVDPVGKPLAVIISIATLEQLVGALDLAQALLESSKSLRHAEILAAYKKGRAALAGAEPTGWQKIETKPPAMEPVLMWDWKQVFIEQWWGPEFHLDKRITHWMPLPTPPKD